jgi:hypothetical protein
MVDSQLRLTHSPHAVYPADKGKVNADNQVKYLITFIYCLFLRPSC